MEDTFLLIVLVAVLVNIVVILTVGFMIDRQIPRPTPVLLLRQTSGPHRRHQRPS